MWAAVDGVYLQDRVVDDDTAHYYQACHGHQVKRLAQYPQSDQYEEHIHYHLQQYDKGLYQALKLCRKDEVKQCQSYGKHDG